MQVTDNELRVLIQAFCRFFSLKFSTKNEENAVNDFINYWNRGSVPRDEAAARKVAERYRDLYAKYKAEFIAAQEDFDEECAEKEAAAIRKFERLPWE